MFDIKIKQMYWINGEEDNPDDLCLHGDVEIFIGNEVFSESGTISALGIRLLKTITEDHHITDGEQMLPCCGHFLIANDNLDVVTILGCCNGIDWITTHENNLVKITTESGHITYLDMVGKPMCGLPAPKNQEFYHRKFKFTEKISHSSKVKRQTR